MSSSTAPSLGSDERALLERIRKRYLGSRDFNGLHIYGDEADRERNAAVRLANKGLIQVVTSADYMNIHIRPWPSRRSCEQQVQDLVALKPTDYGVCLYPTENGMKGVRLPNRMMGRPYDRAMARGRGTLELAYFDFDVLEQYRNDSRFDFSFGDAGATMGISDEAYRDPSVLQREHVSLSHIGFAYDLSDFDPADVSSPITRRVAVFYCDLVELTPEHQRRWETYQVASSKLKPHPLWWGSQMGHWPDGVGPFTRLFMTLTSLNQLAYIAFGESMFRTADRPEDMGWLLRPSQREWDDFILQLDKILSENLRSKFFDRANIAQADADGKPIGTLNRLQQFMQSGGVAEAAARSVLEPLRNIRKARQKPAHTLRANLTDRTFVHRQVALLRDVNDALELICFWLASHPRCTEWNDQHADLAKYDL